MAAVTTEILSSMLRSSLTNLKSFVEILNAELTEEGQGEQCRVTHKEDITRVLNSFGETEAYLEKNSKCFEHVETKINSHFDDEARELIDQTALKQEIAEIIKIVEGKERAAEDDRALPNVDIDENRIAQALESVEDILNEYHPLKLGENAEDDERNEEEEERMSKRLETMQKKAMSKLEKRMSSAGMAGNENDEEFAAELERDDELTDSGEEEAFDYDSLEKCANKPGGRNKEARRNMDARLKEMWSDYKKKLEEVKPLDTKQLFAEAVSGQQNVDRNSLKYFSQFNSSILELFSKEAVVVVGSNMSYVDPISKKEITQPVRNKICDHIYEKETVYGILKKKKSMRCPLPGCSSRSFTINDLEEDDDMATRISHSLARKKTTAQVSVPQDTEDMETEDEDEDDDAMGCDTENDDTQSQELF